MPPTAQAPPGQAPTRFASSDPQSLPLLFVCVESIPGLVFITSHSCAQERSGPHTTGAPPHTGRPQSARARTHTCLPGSSPKAIEPLHGPQSAWKPFPAPSSPSPLKTAARGSSSKAGTGRLARAKPAPPPAPPPRVAGHKEGEWPRGLHQQAGPWVIAKSLPCPLVSRPSPRRLLPLRECTGPKGEAG